MNTFIDYMYDSKLQFRREPGENGQSGRNVMQNALKPREHKKELETAMEKIVLEQARKQGNVPRSVRLIDIYFYHDSVKIHVF